MTVIDFSAFIGRLATASGETILPFFRTSLSIDDKSKTKDFDPVTEADRAAEAAIRRELRAHFPDHAFYGEEEGREGDSAFLWLIDPIDGTKSFVRGYPFFSTQIALMHEGDIVVGVSAAGAYGERMWATRAGGAFLAARDASGGPVRVRVSGAATFDTDVAISTGNLKSLAAGPRWNALAALVRASGRTRGYGDFLHYHLLARGAIDLVIESDLNILDIAPLALIVREAGGVFTDLEGSAVDLATTSALAGPPALHARALAAFRESG